MSEPTGDLKSAWDVAGAFVWTPSAVLSWYGVIERVWQASKIIDAANPVHIDITLPVLLSLAAAFCIARLCGAHA